MSEWQPIESAPKDGTRILAYDDGEMAVMEWVEFRDPRLSYWRAVGSVGDTYIENPTHWMPLPPPPTFR